MLDAIKTLLADPPVQAIVFWLCAIEAVVAALVAAFSRSIVRAAYSLFFTLFALAGFYVLLSADFMAVVQVVVYIGGILALILFGVLLTNRSRADLTMDTTAVYVGAAAVAGMMFVVLIAAISQADWNVMAQLPAIAPTTETLGKLLLSKHLLPFEFVSVTLLVVLLGASYLVRREDD
jgi:NADH:ubiquinone oxidoreductase subunit 6 (subunit J)